MKRRSRGEQMLAAAGLAAPASATKSARQEALELKDDEIKSPPAKRARAIKSGSPGKDSRQAAPQYDKPEQQQEQAAVAVSNIFKLPAELELLASMFDAVRTGRMMLRRRSEKVTYNSVRHVVENMTKREFRVEHLAQMKYLRPQSFDWQYIRTPSASNHLQMEVQLLLTFDRPAAPGAGGSAGKYSGPAETAEFRELLEQYARANPPDPETGKVPPVPQAPLPLRPAASGQAPSRAGSLPLGGLSSPSTASASAVGLLPAASCPPGMLPDVQALGAAASGLGSPSSSGMSGASPAMTRTRSRLGLTAAAGGAAVPPSLTPILEGGTPAGRKPAAEASRPQEDVVMLREDGGEDEAGGSLRGAVAAEGPMLELTQREGSMTATTSQRTGLAAGGVSRCIGAAATPQSKGPRPAGPQTTPTSHHQGGDGTNNNPRLARLHSLLSPAAMQKILQAEAAQAAQTPEAKRRAEMRRAVHLLPHGHELVRLIFGPQGPTVKPLAQVAQLMCERSMQRQGLNVREASNTLVAMARAVPEFLRIEDPRVMADGSARPRSVAISRAANINAVAAKLKALAADPDGSVQAIFERGVGAADATARSGSPGRSVGGGAAAASVPVPGSPAAHLRPRALALSLEGEVAAAAGAATSGNAAVSNSGPPSDSAAGAISATAARGTGLLDMPPPTPSSRRRPPGLPLAPPSPMVLRSVAHTPTRSAAARSDRLTAAAGGDRSILGSTIAAGAAAAPSGGGGADSAPAGAEAFLQRLCRTGAAAVEKAVPPASLKADGNSGDVGSSGGWGSLVGGPSAAAQAEGGLQQQQQDASGRTPGRVATSGARTPGRTAVQEAMLGSIRKSSAKRSCRKVLEGELGVEYGGGDEEAEPVPRRLEGSLFD